MPSIVRHVDFDQSPVYSRPPHDDELYVMRRYASHAGHCTLCANPYDVHRAGRTLCDRGHKYALNVAQYICAKGGKACSLVDHERHQPVQVEIPAGCEVVRDLLRAIERGLRLGSSAPIVSYDSTYLVQERRPVQNSIEPIYKTIAPARSSKRRRESGYLSNRGSLYQSDLADRLERTQDVPRVRTPRR
jgi:hypothetical protein